MGIHEGRKEVVASPDNNPVNPHRSVNRVRAELSTVAIHLRPFLINKALIKELGSPYPCNEAISIRQPVQNSHSKAH